MLKRLAAVMAGTALLVGGAVSAQALTLTISSGAQTVIVNDDDSDGVVNFAGTVNGISVKGLFGVSDFNSTSGYFDIGSLVSSGTGTLSISLYDDISLSTIAASPNLTVQQDLSASIYKTRSSGAAASATVDATVLVDGTEVPGIASSISSTDHAITNGTATVGDTFSLEEVINISLGNSNTSVSLDDGVSVAPVPEPGTMVLLGAGMLGLAIFGKRRMNRE